MKPWNTALKERAAVGLFVLRVIAALSVVVAVGVQSALAQATDPQYQTINGVQTVSSMTAQLGNVGYGGPWDQSSVIAAYADTTGGPVTALPQATPTPLPSSSLASETCAVTARYSSATVQVAIKDYSRALQLCGAFGASLAEPVFLYGDQAVADPPGRPRCSYVPQGGLVIVWSVYPADAASWCSYPGVIPLT